MDSEDLAAALVETACLPTYEKGELTPQGREALYCAALQVAETKREARALTQVVASLPSRRPTLGHYTRGVKMEAIGKVLSDENDRRTAFQMMVNGLAVQGKVSVRQMQVCFQVMYRFGLDPDFASEVLEQALAYHTSRGPRLRPEPVPQSQTVSRELQTLDIPGTPLGDPDFRTIPCDRPEAAVPTLKPAPSLTEGMQGGVSLQLPPLPLVKQP